jgi:hypothetical protein
LKPILVAIFGDKGTVDEYKTFEVLECLSYVRDRDRRQGHFGRAYARVMEREARSRRG